MHAHAQHVRRSAARAATANPVSYLWPAGDGGRRRSAARGTPATSKGSEEITGGHQRGQRRRPPARTATVATSEGSDGSEEIAGPECEEELGPAMDERDTEQRRPIGCIE
jgi:hypothetical protein